MFLQSKKIATLLALIMTVSLAVTLPGKAAADTFDDVCQYFPFDPVCATKQVVDGNQPSVPLPVPPVSNDVPLPNFCAINPLDPICVTTQVVTSQQTSGPMVKMPIFILPKISSTSTPSRTPAQPTTQNAPARPATPAQPTVSSQSSQPSRPYKPAQPCANGTNIPCSTSTPGNPVPFNPCVLSGCTSTPRCSLPHDIDGHWAEIYIRRLCELGVMEGYSDGTFRPNQQITRAELTKMADVAAKIQPNLKCYDADCGSPFQDLDFSWQSRWVRPAWDRGMVQGMTPDLFMPNLAITREQATKIILAAFNFQPFALSKSSFKDVKGWSVGWIELAHQLGIVQGLGNGNFEPTRPITRGEAAKIIAKTIEYTDTHIH